MGTSEVDHDHPGPDGDHGPASEVRSGRPGRARRAARGWLLLSCLLLATTAVLPAGVSLGSALAAPGAVSWQVATVDWVRDHGGRRLVDTAENIYYGLQAPPDAAPAASLLPATPHSRPVSPVDGTGIRLADAPGRTLLPGEGRWYAGRPAADGRPALYTAWFRPDPTHASVVVGVAWLRRGASTLHLVPGIDQPRPGLPGPHIVPTAAIPRLVAVFNSGWRMTDIRGGFYLAGHTYRPLVRGEASAVIDSDGQLTVGQWGRDVGMGRQVVAVRQNLRLVVDGGRVAPGLDANTDGGWGSPKNQYQFTDRSGLGVDTAGNLIYLAGNGLTLHSLAVAMVGAGIVRGMELDIHHGLPMFTSWQPGGPQGSHPTRLIPAMISPLERYFRPEQRDFFYATLR